MATCLLLAAVAATLLTAFAHSYFGERRLIGPLLASNSGILGRPLARQVIRFAWHLTSVVWAGQALLLARAAATPASFDRSVVGAIGILHLGAGLFDAVYTRGKHIGWPLLTAIGLCCLLALC